MDKPARRGCGHNPFSHQRANLAGADWPGPASRWAGDVCFEHRASLLRQGHLWGSCGHRRPGRGVETPRCPLTLRVSLPPPRTYCVPGLTGTQSPWARFSHFKFLVHYLLVNSVLCNHYLYLIPEHSISPKETPSPLAITLRHPRVPFPSVPEPVLGVSHTWTHTPRGLPCLVPSPSVVLGERADKNHENEHTM